MKIYSWNVNGLRAIAKKGFANWLTQSAADVVCIQETKAHPDQLGFDLTHIADYASHFGWVEKKGYSGVGTYTHLAPQQTTVGLNKERFDREGRTLIHQYSDFTLYNIYFPNGKASPERLLTKWITTAFYLSTSSKNSKKIKTSSSVAMLTLHTAKLIWLDPKKTSKFPAFCKKNENG